MEVRKLEGMDGIRMQNADREDKATQSMEDLQMMLKMALMTSDARDASGSHDAHHQSPPGGPILNRGRRVSVNL